MFIIILLVENKGNRDTNSRYCLIYDAERAEETKKEEEKRQAREKRKKKTRRR
jgi:hypothetical protein